MVKYTARYINIASFIMAIIIFCITQQYKIQSNQMDTQAIAKLFKKDENGKKEYQGILKKYNEEKIELEEVAIERKNIAQIKTVYNW